MKSPLFLLCLTLPAFVSANEEIESGSANPFADAMGRKAMVDVMYEPEADLEKGGEFSYRDVELAVPVYCGPPAGALVFGVPRRGRRVGVEGPGPGPPGWPGGAPGRPPPRAAPAAPASRTFSAGSAAETTARA